MSKRLKLRKKLQEKTIDAKGLRSLLTKEGFVIDRVKGSHEVWVNGDKSIVLATHSEDLKEYQIKKAQEILL